jgi:hypothetical protein
LTLVKPRLAALLLGLAALPSIAGIAPTVDQNGRLKRSELPVTQGEAAGRASEADYDAAGNAIKRRQVGSDGSLREHLAFYDAQNRVVREVSPVMDPTVDATARRQICRVYNALGDLAELWVGPTADSTSATCNYADNNLKKQVAWLHHQS